MAIGPLARLLAQVIVPVIAVVARALPAAYAQALQNARKSGVSAAAASAAESGSSMLRTKAMAKEEALSILNINETDLLSNSEKTIEMIEQQYEKYMKANEVKKIPGSTFNTGSFYLQSKVYRARESLLQFYKEQQYATNKNQ